MSLTGWKNVMVFKIVPNRVTAVPQLFKHVAGVRLTPNYLVIRQGAFPDEIITHIPHVHIAEYFVEMEEDTHEVH